jgi:predicted metalloprotease
MKWDDQPESENVEDRRRIGKTGLAVGGGGLVVLIIALLLGIDPQKLAGLLGQGQGPGAVVQPDGRPGQRADPAQGAGQAKFADPEEERLAHFAKVIFGDTEKVWDKLFQKMGKEYTKPTLVLFTGEVQTACGGAEAAVGPFYCPGDSRVYIDLSFYKDMQRKLNAPGEFARAYVIAHEVGHHVQRLLGYSKAVDRARQTMSKRDYNKMSVRLELQADYLAGVWAHHGQEEFKFLEKGDIESALNAAFQIGDDRLQKQARGYVVPDSFTHGTSKQRQRWFEQGFQTGDVGQAQQLFDLDYDSL